MGFISYPMKFWRHLHQMLSIRCYVVSSASRGKTELFTKSKQGSFFQEPPCVTNPFLSDHFLQRCLAQLLPNEVHKDIFEDLSSFGTRICDEIDHLGRIAELEPPKLKAYDEWGKRVDELITSQAWKDLHSISAEEGLVALAYERTHAQWSRVHQMAKLILFAPSSGLYTCPLAMTDGAAKLIETSGDSFIKDRAFLHLTSRSPENFWTSGQWMTERGGGSDVGSGTCTFAKGPLANSLYKLYGHKWFSSATDAQVVFTLARISDEEGMVIEGSQGLSLFYLETKNSKGDLNGLEIQKLKNKLGTRQLPTAEVLLDGTTAHLIGEQGRGIPNISPMLTITRLHNSVCSIGNMRRMLQICRDYSTKRIAFGKYLYEHPLHIRILSRMELQTRGCTLLVLEVCRLMGLDDCQMLSPQEDILLRILTPLAKLYTAKQAIQIASEGLEAIGGQGYIEDTGLPTLFRDAQVLSIWEGTTNILSLDIIKVINKSRVEMMQSIMYKVTGYLNRAANQDLKVQANYLKKQLNIILAFGENMATDPTIAEVAARDFGYSLAYVYIGSLLINHASTKNSTPCDRSAALRWCHQPFPLLDSKLYSEDEAKKDLTLIMNGKTI